jgi:threonine dehydrogenase-like Zn-dependent dehydrogenase
VGDVVTVGSNVTDEWLGRRVFVFHPHESHFLAKTEDLIPIPPEMSATEALFFPNMETAVNLLMDGLPIIGECVMVLGQGVVGLLTTALLSKFPLSLLITLDRHPLRRQVSLELGAHHSMDPAEEHIGSRISEIIQSYTHQLSPDLVYELSGEPSALEFAVESAGFDSRIVIGSWYGTQKAELSLGKDFHRNRVRLSSSQVSTIAPGFSGRWTKSRRLEVVWKMIDLVKPERFISHRFPLNQAKQAFELLDKEPQTAIQVVFSYDE